MSIRNFISASLTALGALAATLALSAAPASAGIIHHYLSQQITETPASANIAGPLNPRGGLAFDNVGNLLLGNGRGGQFVIDLFSPTNVFQQEVPVGGEPEGIAVEAAAGNLYVSIGLRIHVYKPNGGGGYTQLSEWTGANTAAKTWEHSLRVAVDNSTSISDPHRGDVYVVEENNSRSTVVDVMKPKPAGPTEAEEGSLVAEISNSNFLFQGDLKIVVNPMNGEVYLINVEPIGGVRAVSVVDEFDASGAFLRALNGAETPAGNFGAVGEGSMDELASDIAVDAIGDVYVADPEHGVVDEFDASGKYAGQISDPSGASARPSRVGASPNGDVYIVFGQAIDVFGPNLIVPDTTAGPAPSVGQRTVTLGGTVNPDGEPVSTCQFEFSGPEFSSSRMLHDTVPCSSLPGFGGTPITVSSVAIGELPPGGTYTYKLVAGNANGATPSRETTIQLEGVTPTVNDQEPVARAITTTAAAVAATINPGGRDTNYHVVYGTTSAYGASTPPMDAGSGSFDEEATPAPIEGLEPGTTYHYALVAENEAGKVTGPDYTFTTAALPEPPPPPPPPPPAPVFANPLTVPIAPPLVATPNIAFPSEAGPTTPKPAACKRGYKRAKNGACAKTKRSKGHRKPARKKK